MSDGRPSFLVLVPKWQAPLEITENMEIKPTRRRTSEMSVSSITSTTSSGYGENGFLVLTTTPNVEDAIAD
jgi:hypothetical protein